MAWLQLKIQTNAETAESLTAFLHLLSAAAVTLQDSADQPVFEPAPDTTPLWSCTTVVALFTENTDLEPIVTFLAKQFNTHFDYQINLIEDQDWERAWLVDFHARRYGQHLWVCPSTEEPPDTKAINIILDPGLAFGTGTHPTTALCLEWLDAHPPHDQLVIDYGCGSGILAIAALKLGAHKVWAVDHDPQALEATQMNAERNKINNSALHTVLPADLPPLQADTIVANILANPLIELAPRFASLLKAGGTLVLTGILNHQADSVSAAYMTHFKIAETVIREDWVQLIAVRLC